MHKEQSEITIALIAGTVILLLLGVFILSMVLVYKKRQHKLLEEKNILKQQYQQELLRTQLEIQEQTLKNISQEIHDNIGQTLSLVKLNLNTITWGNSVTSQEKIQTSKELVGKAINDLRSLSKSLYADVILASGLIKAIENELQMIEKAGFFQTEFTLKGSAVILDPKKELILYRVVQEALNNIIKHSEAQKISVNVEIKDRIFTLEIIDDGKGLDPDLPDKQTGSGLRNMRNRVDLIGGNFELISSNSGTSILIKVPINES